MIAHAISRPTCAKFARTTSGSLNPTTVVMALIVAWRILNNVTWRRDTRLSKHILVVGLVERHETDSRVSRPCVQLDLAPTKEDPTDQMAYRSRSINPEAMRRRRAMVSIGK